jgi:hypothetical protein
MKPNIGLAIKKKAPARGPFFICFRRTAPSQSGCLFRPDNKQSFRFIVSRLRRIESVAKLFSAAESNEHSAVQHGIGKP